MSSPDLDSLSQGSGSQPGGRSNMGVETRWSSKEDLLSDRGGVIGSPTTSGVNNSGSLTMDQIENSLFVALYDFNSMIEDQLTLRKGNVPLEICFFCSILLSI